MTLGDISPESVQQLADEELAAGNSPSTVKGIVLVLKMIIRYCEKQGWMPERKYEIIFPKRKEKTSPRVLLLEEEKQLLSWLSENPSLINIGLLICLCCGLRIGEVCALKWEDIDIRQRVIHIRRTVHRIYRQDLSNHKSELTLGVPKTEDSRREIPISNYLVRILNKVYLDSSGTICRLRNEKPDGSADIQKSFQESSFQTRNPGKEGPQPEAHFRHQVHREQMRLQDFKFLARSRRHHHDPESLRPPRP
jgi:integrase